METVSFRIGSNLRSTLEGEAKKAGVSLNSLVSQIFGRYANWDRYAGKLKFIPVSKDLLREVFQTVGKERIVEMGKSLAETSGREQVLFLFQELSLGTLLQFVELWVGHFDAYEHRHDGKTHRYTIHHDINRNFSLFAKEYITNLLQETIGKPVKFEAVSPNALTFSFEG